MTGRETLFPYRCRPALALRLRGPLKDWPARMESCWFNWPRTAVHSKKPEAFLDMVEQSSRGPYLELFARRQRLGWDTWGEEALPHVEMAS